jgi:hypothetical protein
MFRPKHVRHFCFVDYRDQYFFIHKLEQADNHMRQLAGAVTLTGVLRSHV